MPLQLDYTTLNGTIYPESYWVVLVLNIDREAKNAVCVLKGFMDKQKYVDKFVPIDQKVFVIEKEKTEYDEEGNATVTQLFDTYYHTSALNPENINTYRNTYEYIKTLPEFASALTVDL